MNDRWKLATMTTALVVTTALVTSVTTAHLTRPAASADAAPTAPVATPVRHLVTAPAPPAVRPARPAVQRVAYEPAATATTVPAATASDCTTGGDRALRVAKPGAIGALIGAGVGAAGGAVADGGKAAGKGALIGGLAGAVLGGGYGAYKTKQECGTIFGEGRSRTAARQVVAPTVRGGDAQSAFASAPDGGITVFSAR